LLGRKAVCIGPALALVAAVLGGCSGSDSPSPFAFGKVNDPPPPDPKLFPAQYKTEIAEFMRTYLNNPTKVKDALVGQPVLKTVAGQPQYVTCVRYNARDSKNQYEGSKTNLAIFLGGRLNQFLDGRPDLCADLAYQRYPEIESMVP
jgi:hypothetical protein